MIEKKKTMSVRTLEDKFVYAEKVEEILDLAVETGQNVVLHGPGGYGKSEMVAEYFKDDNIFIKSLGQGTTWEDLIPFDINKFKKTGVKAYMPNDDSCFMSHEIVCFEEGFDAPMDVLEQLKDVLQSRIFRNGKQQYNIKTKLVIICTNRNREELAEDLSIKALMERFPLDLNVVWKAHKTANYEYMFKTVHGVGNLEFAALCEEMRPSPRAAMNALIVFKAAGIHSLEFCAEFKGLDVQKAIEEREELIQIAEERDEFDSYDLALDNVFRSLDRDIPLDIFRGVKRARLIQSDYSSLSVSDTNFDYYREISTEIKNRIEYYLNLGFKAL